MMSDNLARAVLDALPDATAVVDPAGTIVDVNQAWLMFAVDNGGQPERTGAGVNYLDLCAQSAASGCQDAARAADGLRAVLAGHTVHSELEYPCPSPAVNRWFLMRITPLGGDLGGAVTSHVNITRRKMAEQELAHQAAHDPLTGLANRSLFANRLKTALTSRRDPAGSQVGLMYLDADGLKQINDAFGHDAGDEALLTIGHRLRSHVRPQDTVARLGEDEFAVTAPRISADGLDGLCGRVTAALSQPHLIHGHLVPVPVSIGIHLAPPGESADTALRQADQAMYVAKRRTR
jgi:diguanylate cyclase (GGDEF)-like protein